MMVTGNKDIVSPLGKANKARCVTCTWTVSQLLTISRVPWIMGSERYERVYTIDIGCGDGSDTHDGQIKRAGAPCTALCSLASKHICQSD